MSTASQADGDRTTTQRVLIIMPARNEAARIGALLCELRDRVPQAEILVIDDESSDATPAVAVAAGASVARLPFHLGYGAALQTGYKFAMAHGFDFVVQMDADGQHRPAQVPALLKRVTSGSCDLAIGSRFAQAGDGSASNPEARYEMQTLRSIGRRMLCFFARLGGLHVTDPTSGFQALNQRSLQLFASSWYPSDYPDVDVLLLAHRSGLRIQEEPVDMAPSPRPAALGLDARVLRLPDAPVALGRERRAALGGPRSCPTDFQSRLSEGSFPQGELT